MHVARELHARRARTGLDAVRGLNAHSFAPRAARSGCVRRIPFRAVASDSARRMDAAALRLHGLRDRHSPSRASDGRMTGSADQCDERVPRRQREHQRWYSRLPRKEEARVGITANASARRASAPPLRRDRRRDAQPVVDDEDEPRRPQHRGDDESVAEHRDDGEAVLHGSGSAATSIFAAAMRLPCSMLTRFAITGISASAIAFMCWAPSSPLPAPPSPARRISAPARRRTRAASRSARRSRRWRRRCR